MDRNHKLCAMYGKKIYVLSDELVIILPSCFVFAGKTIEKFKITLKASNPDSISKSPLLLMVGVYC